MLDLAAGMENRNFTLRKTADIRTLLESLKTILPLAMIAGALCFHVGIRGQNIQIGYQSQRLKEKEQNLLRIQQHIIVEEQKIMDPRSLEAFAKNDLEMIILPANRIIPAPLDNWNTGSASTPILGSLFRTSEPKESPALN